jgi:glycosyltransferase involved in cell wall biosynthesis
MRDLPHDPMRPPPLLLHVFPSFAVGGAQRRMAAVANRLGPAFRHAVIALDGDRTARARLDPALAVAFPEVTLPKRTLLAGPRAAAAALAALRPDLLVTHNWGSIEFALANAWPLRRPLPHVHIEDGFGPEEQGGQLRRRVLLRRLALRRAVVVLPSRTLCAIAERHWRLPARRLRYIPNGIDLARFTPDAAPDPPPWPRDLPVIGTVAALRAEKNLARLLHAFAALRPRRPARLVIVGDGPERAALAALAGALGIAPSVIFAGATEDTPRAYRNFDVFALSSDTEQMPLSVLEAMASALPVAASDVGDVAAMLDAANRPYVVARDAAALTGALAALLADPAGARAIGAANRARAAQEFDQAHMFAAYAALFGMLCSAP